jgi:hypothetical protein
MLFTLGSMVFFDGTLDIFCTSLRISTAFPRGTSPLFVSADSFFLIAAICFGEYKS